MGTLMRSCEQIPGWDPTELQAEEGFVAGSVHTPLY